MGWFLRTFTGLLIAILILGVGGYFAVQYAMTQLTATPPKPTFPNDNPNYSKQASAKNAKAAADKDVAPAAAEPKSKPIPEGAYEGQVKQPVGLIVRSSPELGAGQVDGVEYNEPVVVLSKSKDELWEKIRYGTSEKEGWVKAGNIQKKP
jgi:cytoskeletal protein RodZ